MKRLLCTLLLLSLSGWSAQPAHADELGDDSTLRGSGSDDPCDLGFCDREWQSQVGMAARRSGPGARYRSADGTSSYNCNNTTSGGERIIRYPFMVQDTSALEWVRVWGVKGANTADLFLNVYSSCMSQTEVTPTTTSLGQTTFTSTGGQFSTPIFLNNHSPQNLNCKYWLEVRFGDSSTACAANHLDLRIYKMRVQSRRPDLLFHDRFSN